MHVTIPSSEKSTRRTVSTSITSYQHSMVRRLAARIGRPALAPRYMSLHAIPVAVEAAYDAPTAKTATLGHTKLGQAIAAAPGETYTRTLAQTHFASTAVRTPTAAEKVKHKTADLLANKDYDSLLRVLVAWTGAASEVDWRQVFTPAELSHVVAQLVTYQIGLITKAGTALTMENRAQRRSARAQLHLAHAHEVREQLRSIYAGLLYGDGHLYKRGRTSNYNLRSQDYENLILLELNNGKLDLASLWFRHLEQRPGGAPVMTHRLWVLRFQVYGGALPALWRVAPSELYEVEVNPRQSRLKAERPWLEIFNEFIRERQAAGSAHIVFDRELVAAMLASVAYSGSVLQLRKLVELNWGVTHHGKLVLPPLLRSDPLYPDLEVLRTIVVAMIFNNEFVASMAYINAFQEHYGIDLALPRAKHFWDQIFRWSEIKTRFSEYRALQHYIKETASGALLRPTSADDYTFTLEEAKRSAHFDYEGYLKYVADLTNQRASLLNELWKCYHQCEPGFSVRVYRTYLKAVTEDPLDARCYDLLSQLALQHHMHQVAPDSYNAGMVKDRARAISQLYTKAMKVLLNYKGSRGELGQMAPIVAKWSLDDAMREHMTAWVEKQERHFLEMMNDKKTEDFEDEDDDRLLGLM